MNDKIKASLGHYLKVMMLKSDSPRITNYDRENNMISAIQHITQVWSSKQCQNVEFRLFDGLPPLRLKDLLIFLYNISTFPNLFTTNERSEALESISIIVGKLGSELDHAMKKVVNTIVSRLIARLEFVPPIQKMEVVNFLSRCTSFDPSILHTLQTFVKAQLKIYDRLDDMSRIAACTLAGSTKNKTMEIHEMLKDLAVRYSESNISDEEKAALIYAYVSTLLYQDKNLIKTIEKIQERFKQTKNYKAKKYYLKLCYSIMIMKPDYKSSIESFLLEELMSDDISTDYIYQQLVKYVLKQKNNELAKYLVSIGYSHVSNKINKTPNKVVFASLIKLALRYQSYAVQVSELVRKFIDNYAICPAIGHELLTMHAVVQQEPIAIDKDIWEGKFWNFDISIDAYVIYSMRPTLYSMLPNFDMFNIDESYGPIKELNAYLPVPIYPDQISVLVSMIRDFNRFQEFIPVARIIFHERIESIGKVSGTVPTLLDKYAKNAFLQLLLSLAMNPNLLDDERIGQQIIRMVISNYYALQKSAKKPY